MSTLDTTSPRGFLSPSLRARLNGYFGIRTRFQGAAWFFLKDIWARLRLGELRVLFRNSDIREQAFAEFYTAARHNFIAFESTTAVASLVPAAHGTVLDLGPGAGTQLGRFDAACVDHIFGVEPNTAFAPAFNDRLRETALGQDGKYTLVPCGVEDGETLAQYGVVEGSIDCVVCMQVLCSVPRPEEQARHLYRLLKPGGELLFWEHCRNTDVVTRAVQWLWGLVWPSVFGGCRLDRVTKEAFLDAGVWQTVEVETSMEPHDLMPRVWGRLVKPVSCLC